MALKEWFDEDKYFEFANDYLLKHKKSPNAVIMRDFCEGNGSLSTHQKLIEQWKQTRHVDLIELPEKAETLIVNKARELFAEGWKALEAANRDENLKIQQEANEAVQIVQDTLNQIQKEKEAIARRLDEISERLELANAQNQSLLEKINESEKLRFAAEEARRMLVENYNEFRETSKREKEDLEKRHLLQVDELRNQIAVNARQFQDELERREGIWENNKRDLEGRLATQEIIKEELNEKLTHAKSEIGFYEIKYQQGLRDLETKAEEIANLKNENQNISTHLEENKTLRIKHSGQIDQLEKQLNESREKNASLEYALKMQNSRVRELEESLNMMSGKPHELSPEEVI